MIPHGSAPSLFTTQLSKYLEALISIYQGWQHDLAHLSTFMAEPLSASVSSLNLRACVKFSSVNDTESDADIPSLPG
jgi:hypothetical protein